MRVPIYSRWISRLAPVLLMPPIAIVLMALVGEPDPPPPNLERAALAVGLLLATLLGGALTLLVFALAETARGGPPSLETSWGGFGGGLGGWHLSPALTYLLGALFLRQREQSASFRGGIQPLVRDPWDRR